MNARPGDGATVRLLSDDELTAGARVVATGMLGAVDDATTEGWAAFIKPERSHGAYAADGSLVGLARWFPSELSVPGGSVAAGCVTAVAVLPTHRRQGHLTRLMNAQLDALRAAQIPVALLIAAEYPIYGRFGYGPAIDACGWEIDANAARFRAPATGQVELCDPAALRPHIQAMHDLRWARTPGAVTRDDDDWDHFVGLKSWPNDKTELGLRRGAIWRDDRGEVQGAVAYTVHESWTRNRPAGKAEVKLLVGATVEAERELWRHLCELDWIDTVAAGGRSIDDPLPLFLTDARAAAQIDRSDCIWVRLLDLPEAFRQRRSLVADRVVVDVTDVQGYVAGRWAIALGPDSSAVELTTEDPDVALSAAALGAAYLGGTSITRLHEAGWIDEHQPGAIARLDTLLRIPTSPWSPTTF